MSASTRLLIAQTHLAALGEYVEGESADKTERREHWTQVADECHEQISEAQRASLPYKED